ncbi:uncharacterized protein BXZ73DRAFT_81765 [Epithele typhae]|uniref:uncharacterized protein n=1 Tax=Epithele typhae TaxID=378194 RepID=UPI0020084576|nr:uncharacterized protein BXZ73DRAFT_81765 [Epithele typhae]KAH9913956.1 hypothetical protein BXZ73DRAFT_81765 [Epithele typhae]
MGTTEVAAPEDFLSDSLESLYDHVPVAHSTAGSLFTYQPFTGGPVISLMTPDTQAANWALHASSIWSSSLYVAEHLDDLHLHKFASITQQESRPLRVLELGAGAGLPSILLAKTFHNVFVTCSDYPDPDLIGTLAENAKRNEAVDRCRVVPFAWGSDPSPLLRSQAAHTDPVPGFDVVLAADTLWNSDTHRLFVKSLQITLKRAPHARIHLVAGLHTGRYVLESFLKLMPEAGFVAEQLEERRVGGTEERAWSVERADGEDEQERRRWVIWMVFKWADC